MSECNRLSGIVVAFLVTASGWHPVQAEPLRIFYFNWAGYGPFFLAQEKGFFAEEGIEVELINVEETHAAYAGLFGGQVDAVAAAPHDIPFFATPDEMPLCVLVTDDSRGGDGVVARKDIRSIADLQGKTVAFERGSISHFYLNVLLKEAGLSEADIEAVDVPDADGATVFLLGEADATVTWGSMLLDAKQAAHGHLLTDSSDQPGLLVSGLITTPAAFEVRKPDYDGQRNREFFGTPDRPGQVYQTIQHAIDIWSSLGELDVALTPADVIRHDLWVE